MKFKNYTIAYNGDFEIYLESEAFHHSILPTNKELDAYRIDSHSRLALKTFGTEGMVEVGAFFNGKCYKPSSFAELDKMAQFLNNIVDERFPQFLPVYVDDCVFGVDIGHLFQVFESDYNGELGIIRTEVYNFEKDELQWHYEIVDGSRLVQRAIQCKPDCIFGILEGYSKGWEINIFGERVPVYNYEWKEIGGEK